MGKKKEKKFVDERFEDDKFTMLQLGRILEFGRQGFMIGVGEEDFMLTKIPNAEDAAAFSIPFHYLDDLMFFVEGYLLGKGVWFTDTDSGNDIEKPQPYLN